MFRKHPGWGVFLVGLLQAGSFQEPNGLYSLTYPSNWEVRVVQQDGNPVFLLQRTPAYDATLLMDLFPGAPSGDAVLPQVATYVQQLVPQARFVGDWTVQERGEVLRAYRDLAEEAGGKSTRARLYVVRGAHYAVILLGICEASNFSSILPELNAMARSVQLARPDPAAAARLAGTTWVGGTGYTDVLNEFSASAEWRYTFMADGRFVFQGAAVASDPGMVGGAYGGGQSGTFFVIGRKVFLLYDDGGYEILTFIAHDVLEDQGGRRFIPQQ